MSRYEIRTNQGTVPPYLFDTENNVALGIEQACDLLNGKRYLLFAGYTYYPSGGWGDYRGSFDSMEEARAEAEKLKKDWCQIVDSQTLMEVS